MKKVLLLAAVLCVSSTVFAEEKAAPKEGAKPAVEQARGPQGHEAFAKAHKEQMAKMKATEEKMEKLVKEYNALKDGKKKDAKRAELEKEVAAIHEEQLKFKQKQLGEFEKRLDQMKKNLAEENTAEGKKAWVNQKTDALIEKGGDLKVLFDRPQGPGMDGKPGHHGKGPHFKGGKKGPKGDKGSKGPLFGGPKHDKQPPVAELPVERPVEK